jgi:hypothetical protein
MQALLAADLSDNYKLTVDTLIQLQNGITMIPSEFHVKIA